MGLLFFGSGFASKGQSNIRENVYLHLSNNELIVGETLYFSCYVYSESTGKPSHLSSLVYLDVLDENNKSVYRTQIALYQGVGSGQYYLPSELETGNYHLVAYTRWMQNFEDFFHQRITIYNPYKTFNIPSKMEVHPNISLFPEGGRLVNNIQNRMVVCANDSFGRGYIIKGRVIDADGNTISKVETDASGCFGFSFVPREGETYQLITETGAGFNFYDLLLACEECTHLAVVENSNSYLIELKSNRKKVEKHELLILNNKDTLRKQTMFPDDQMLIPKSELPMGLIAVVLNVNNEKYSERLFWNGRSIWKDGDRVEKYVPLERVSSVFKIEKPSMVSISVTKVSSQTNENESIIVEKGINNHLESPLRIYDNGLPDHHALDNLLIGSKLKPAEVSPKTVELLPEYQFGIVQGVLVKSNEGEEPLSNEEVGLGFLGINDRISVTKTDTAGRFALMYDYNVPHKYGAIKAMNLSDDSYNVHLKTAFYNDYPDFTNPPVLIDSVKVQQIVKWSIGNQVQNAYYLPDSAHNELEMPYLISGGHSFVLDDFTRFPTMRDTFIELVYDVGVSKNEDKFELKVRMEGVDFRDKQSAPPLLLLDGLFASAKDILQISPYAVERIDVLNRRYYFGNVFFDGVISVHTFKKEITQDRVNDKLVEPLVTQAQNASKTVNVNFSDRIPNYEHLLLWKPLVSHPGGDLNVSFLTSSVTGLFEINIEGIANDGTPITEKKYFEVVKDRNP